MNELITDVDEDESEKCILEYLYEKSVFLIIYIKFNLKLVGKGVLILYTTYDLCEMFYVLWLLLCNISCKIKMCYVMWSFGTNCQGTHD